MNNSTDFFLWLAATATVVANFVAAATVVTTAAEEDEYEDDNPGAVITETVTHKANLLFAFSSHTMFKNFLLLQHKNILLENKWKMMKIKGNKSKFNLI